MELRDLERVDLNLLVTLQMLLEERSISKADSSGIVNLAT